MTANFEGFDSDRPTENSHQIELTDRFELLSAYIDGELSVTDKNLVQTWLNEDPQLRKLHCQLLALQGQIQHSTVPSSEKSTAEITTAVFESLDRQRHRRRLVWGGSAIVASLLAALSLIPGSSQWRMAESGEDRATPVMLAVALNKPAIDIPKGIEGYEVELKTLD